MPDRAAYPAVTPPRTLEEYVRQQNQRLPRLAEQLARVQGLAYRTATAATTLTSADDVLLVHTTGGAFAVTLPAASSVPGKEFRIKKMDASANNVTLTAAGSDTIDGAATLPWNTQYLSYSVVSVITATPATYSWVVT